MTVDSTPLATRTELDQAFTDPEWTRTVYGHYVTYRSRMDSDECVIVLATKGEVCGQIRVTRGPRPTDWAPMSIRNILDLVHSLAVTA